MENFILKDLDFQQVLNFVNMLNWEELQLLQENNKMLKKICNWIDKHDSTDYQNNEDFKNFSSFYSRIEYYLLRKSEAI